MKCHPPIFMGRKVSTCSIRNNRCSVTVSGLMELPFRSRAVEFSNVRIAPFFRRKAQKGHGPPGLSVGFCFRVTTGERVILNREQGVSRAVPEVQCFRGPSPYMRKKSCCPLRRPAEQERGLAWVRTERVRVKSAWSQWRSREPDRFATM